MLGLRPFFGFSLRAVAVLSDLPLPSSPSSAAMTRACSYICISLSQRRLWSRRKRYQWLFAMISEYDSVSSTSLA